MKFISSIIWLNGLHKIVCIEHYELRCYTRNDFLYPKYIHIFVVFASSEFRIVLSHAQTSNVFTCVHIWRYIETWPALSSLVSYPSSDFSLLWFSVAKYDPKYITNGFCYNLVKFIIRDSIDITLNVAWKVLLYCILSIRNTHLHHGFYTILRNLFFDY